MLPGLVASIKFGKTMRWNATNVACGRCAGSSLLGEMVIPFEYAGLAAGRTTYGPRRGFPELTVSSAEAYLPLMAEHHVIVDRGAPCGEVSRQVAQLRRRGQRRDPRRPRAA